MRHRFGLVAAFGVVLVALAAGGLGYNIGLSRGLAVAAAPAAGTASAYPLAAPYLWYHPWGFGFGFGPLLFLFFAFFVFRGLLWGGYRHRWYESTGGVPQRFDEWHRRAHDQMNGPQPQAPSRP
jgi:hypothetical protein